MREGWWKYLTSVFNLLEVVVATADIWLVFLTMTERDSYSDRTTVNQWAALVVFWMWVQYFDHKSSESEMLRTMKATLGQISDFLQPTILMLVAFGNAFMILNLGRN